MSGQVPLDVLIARAVSELESAALRLREVEKILNTMREGE